MMKRLLGSTALLGALAFVGGEATAATPAMTAPKLTISGQSTFNMWWFGQKKKERGAVGGGACDYIGKGRGYLATVDDARLKFDITGKTDPGMDYGFTIVVNGDTNAVRNIKENYLYFGGTWGKLTLGDSDGVEDIMAFYGGDALGGTGGFDGNFDRVVNFTTGSVVSVDLVGDTGKSTKITYQTPRWKGFQAGISYTPRTGHKGERATDTLRSYTVRPGDETRMPYGTHNIAIALNWINKFANGLELALSGTAVFEDTHSPCAKLPTGISTTNLNPIAGSSNLFIKNKFENTASFALGFLAQYKGFDWAGEFGYNGDSREVKKIYRTTGSTVVQSKSPGQTWFIDTGLAYTWGATKLSTGYYYSEREAVRIKNGELKRTDANTHIVSVSADHKVAPGVGFFAEYAHYHMHNKGAGLDQAVNNLFPSRSTSLNQVRSNEANVIVLGTKIKF